MLAYITRRDNHLRIRHIIVLEEDDSEEITSHVVVVDDLSDLVDEADDSFGV